MKNGLIIDKNGNKYYYLNDRLHREDGPAVEWANGYKLWFLHGKLHREDGPAIDYPNGGESWYYHGKRLDCSSQQEFERLLKMKAFW